MIDRVLMSLARASSVYSHEKMSCLYTNDATSGHSTRFATALDGNGVYGHYLDGGAEPAAHIRSAADSHTFRFTGSADSNVFLP